MITKKSVHVKHTEAEIKLTFEPVLGFDVEYHIEVGSHKISLTRPEFVMLSEIMEDWFKGNAR